MAETRPAAESRPANGARETRLLLATIAVSVAVLLLLARFRSPEEAARPAADAAPPPLERLAARATYDELAAIMIDVERRIAPSIVVVGGQANGAVSYTPAVRVLPDRAVAVLARNRRVVPVSTAQAPQIISRDAVRELIVIQSTARSDAVAIMPSVAPRPGPRYLTIVEATAQGPAVRPVYVGRTELFADPRWPDSVLAVTAIQQTLPAGSAVFSLDGGFIGLVAESNGTVTVIPASTLLSVVRAVPAASAPRGQLPFDVQTLTPQLARAAGAEKGVMVSYMFPGTRADLASGDVIQSIDGIGVTTVGGFRQIEQSRTPGESVTITAIRRGQPLRVTITATEPGAGNAAANDYIGAVLRNVPGAGAEIVTIQPGGAAAQAGLRAGDLIVALEQTRQPDASSIERAFRTARPGEALLLTIRRDTDHQVLALEKR
jgi:hypothetical protein